jgi:hypothetical protein
MRQPQHGKQIKPNNFEVALVRCGSSKTAKKHQTSDE